MKITREKILRRLKKIRHEFLSRALPIQKSTEETPQVSYALQAPKSGEIATGGRVKLIALSEEFPESRRANILYLVSSALPANYRYWVERAMTQGIPIVLNQNGVATPGWAGAETESINAPLRWVLERANVVLYQSEFCKKSADRFLGLARGAFRITYNAVDLECFNPSAPEKNRPFTILLGGSQYQKYRITSALETFAIVRKSIPEARFLISGKVDWQNDPHLSLSEAKDLAKSLGIGDRVTFTGPFLQANAPQLYQSADLLLHTKYNDPCPTAVIEALACGLGVIYSKSGGLPELVNDTCGIAVPVPESYDTDHTPSAEAWASAIFEASRRLPEIRIAARKRAEAHFGVTQWIGIHREVFNSLTTRRTR